MSDNNTLRGVPVSDELLENRLWKSLDTITDRLGSIEKQLVEVVRLEERVNSHERIIGETRRAIERHDKRLHEAELWQANYGDRASVERLVTNVQQDILDVKKKINTIESSQHVSTGQKEVGWQVLKWVTAIISAVIIFNLTKK